MGAIELVHANTFLNEVLRLIGAPYIWGGKSPQGIDCSGVVTYALYKAGGPDWRAMWNTEKLWGEGRMVDSIDKLPPGGLVFYPGHVMVHVALGIVVGACNGDSSTTTLEHAARMDARVKVRGTFLYRQDVRGFRVLPLRY